MVQAVLRADRAADGRELLTLRDAAEYISELPKAEKSAAEWRIAMEALLLVADATHMIAQIAFVELWGGCLWP